MRAADGELREPEIANLGITSWIRESRPLQAFHWDNGKEKGNYCLGVRGLELGYRV